MSHSNDNQDIDLFEHIAWDSLKYNNIFQLILMVPIFKTKMKI